jgi:GDP-4-dehydro-6-deoxy-D-mannose reductase
VTRALITAVDCFIGSWLAESLVADGVQVVGAARRDPGSRDGVDRHVVDIRDRDAVFALIRDTKPDVIYHLAARSNVRQSVDDPVLTFTTNVTGSLHVFDAVRAHAKKARVISVGSSAEYGETAQTTERLRENDALVPKSPYGVSKAAQAQLARIYARTHDVDVMHVRPFAIIGPRKSLDAISDWCTNIVRIERGEASDLKVGNTSAVRDFVDVRDCVSALRLIADQGEHGKAYNICHGTGTTLTDVIELLRKASTKSFPVVPDPARQRGAVDDLRLVGDPARVLALGYASRFALAETLSLTLEYWRLRQET